MSQGYDEDDVSGSYGIVGSFPKGFGYGSEEPDHDVAGAGVETKPRILLMGLRRSGKSSIQKVVFHKMSPNETLFLESTNKIVKDDVSNSSFVQFQIWDFPGQIDFFDPTFDSEMIFGGCGALIYVIDAQDDYMEALARLHVTVSRAYKVNPEIKFEVFIHKVDGLSDDNKMETQRDIHQRANDELTDAGLENLHLSFYLTSIYDHSIFEAFSKVVQKLIPQLATLENLLNILISNSGIEKAFLFDVVSKIYIATDSSPVDMQSYELCCDMIDVVIDISCIYGPQTPCATLIQQTPCATVIQQTPCATTIQQCHSHSTETPCATIIQQRQVVVHTFNRDAMCHHHSSETRCGTDIQQRHHVPPSFIRDTLWNRHSTETPCATIFLQRHIVEQTFNRDNMCHHHSAETRCGTDIQQRHHVLQSFNGETLCVNHLSDILPYNHSTDTPCATII